MGQRLWESTMYVKLAKLKASSSGTFDEEGKCSSHRDVTDQASQQDIWLSEVICRIPKGLNTAGCGRGSSRDAGAKSRSTPVM
jgi:hypothetical protein